MAAAPESVNWYIDLIKWLLGIAAGVLVFGFDKLTTDGWPMWLTCGYLASVGLLALSVVLGILACWQWLPYANRIELGHAPTNPALQKLSTRGTTFYAGMATTFLLGVVLFAVVWVVSFLRPAVASTANIKLIPAGTAATFLVVNQPTQNAGIQVLSQEPNGTYTWKPVFVPKSP